LKECTIKLAQLNFLQQLSGTNDVMFTPILDVTLMCDEKTGRFHFATNHSWSAVMLHCGIVTERFDSIVDNAGTFRQQMSKINGR